MAGKEPVVTATGYKNAEQCEKAGDLMKEADQTARGSWGERYTISCTEAPAEG
ncbi:hypothetical protein D3C84_1315350 [compost metagenome]